jgi:hypothetical protein
MQALLAIAVAVTVTVAVALVVVMAAAVAAARAAAAVWAAAAARAAAAAAAEMGVAQQFGGWTKDWCAKKKGQNTACLSAVNSGSIVDPTTILGREEIPSAACADGKKFLGGKNRSPSQFYAMIQPTTNPTK